MDIEPLVAPLRADVVSGASAVARQAADVVRRVADEAPVESLPAFRRTVADLVVGILDVQPAMAPLVHLGARAIRATREADTVTAGRRAVRSQAAAFLEELDSASATVARAALEILPDHSRILTLSSSSTVRASLVLAARDRDVRVICLESRPMSEGRRLAESLAGAGVPVTFAVDAAVDALVRRCHRVVLGADSVGDAGVVNKIGSVVAARAAREAAVPVYVLTDHTKLVPPGFPQPLEDDRPPDEVWPSRPDVRIWNRYFEYLSLDLVEAVVTEDGPHSPGQLRDRRRKIGVPSRLRAWAREASG